MNCVTIQQLLYIGTATYHFSCSPMTMSFNVYIGMLSNMSCRYKCSMNAEWFTNGKMYIRIDVRTYTSVHTIFDWKRKSSHRDLNSFLLIRRRLELIDFLQKHQSRVVCIVYTDAKWSIYLEIQASQQL